MTGRLLKSTVALLLTAATIGAAVGEEAWRTSGFETPESVAYDEANDRFIVSNIVGDAMQADGNGTLSTVGPDGSVIEDEWVTGLDAPKGVAVADGKAYVADLTNLRIVDLATGEIETVAIEGAIFLNDAAAGPDGAVYLSDTGGNAIYRYQDGTAELWLRDDRLSSPNGLLVDGDTLVVASFGTMAEDPAESQPGGLYYVDIASKEITKDVALGDLGFLDGIVKVDERYYITDFMAGTVLGTVPGGPVETVETLKMGTADLGTDGTNLVVPQMMEGEVVSLTID
jgi:sugar lactone lactonase YvrE